MIETLNSWGGIWLAWFLPAVIQNTVFLALLLLLLHFLREYSAQFKYTAAMIGVCKLLLPPFLPARLKAAASTVSAQLPVDLDALSSTPPPPPPPADWVPPPPQLTVPGIIITVWLAVVLLYILYIIVSTARLRYFLKHARPVETINPDLIANNIRVLQSSSITMPLSLGPFTRTIYVPQRWRQWSERCRTMVLRHEIAHIERRDGLFQLLQLLMQALYFFHPLVHVLNKQINEYREMACDDMSAGSRRETSIEYSRYLVEIAEKLVHNPVSCGSVSALIRQKHELVKRISYQISEARMKPLSTARKRMITGGLILLIIPLSWYYTTAGPAVAGQDGTTVQKDKTFSIYKIHINQDNTITYGNETYSMQKFDNLMGVLKKSTNSDAVIGISADEGVTMGIVNNLHEALVANDLLKITYVDQKGDNFSLMLPPASARETLETSAKKHVYQVWINSDSKLLLGKDQLSPASADQLKEETAKLIDTDEKIIFSLVTSSSTPFHSFLTVLSTLKKGGAERIVVGNPPPPPKSGSEKPEAADEPPPPPPPGK